MSTKQYKTLLDRPYYTGHIRNFDKMTVELSPYMSEYEIDQCIEFMLTLKDTKFDVNPSTEDCKTQLQIMFGRDRFLEICKAWNAKNQKWLTVFGTLKYKHKQDGTYWDGLDETDNPNDYEKVYI
jgi:hypothetical protein